MAIAVLDFNTNQWYVQYTNGELEPCHNRATAETLARQANAEPQVDAEPQMDYDNLYELGLSGAPEVV
tara:strand:+ start:880 stop:1083 length:204 start_codon:yes stop_codon:yes gene_type:complete